MIKESNGAAEKGDLDAMYQALRRLGTRGKRTPRSELFTPERCREHFEKVG